MSETSRPSEMCVTGAKLLVFLHIFLLLSLTASRGRWGGSGHSIGVESDTVHKAEWQVQGLLRADTVNSFPLFWGLSVVRVLLTKLTAPLSQEEFILTGLRGVGPDI